MKISATNYSKDISTLSVGEKQRRYAAQVYLHSLNNDDDMCNDEKLRECEEDLDYVLNSENHPWYMRLGTGRQAKF